jgi:hypothetical protein
MQVKCQIQLSRNTELAMARFTTRDTRGHKQDEVWTVFQDHLSFDPATLAEQPAWGITPTVPAMSGYAEMTGEFLAVDPDHLDRVLIKIPTADPSDAWRKMIVDRDAIQLHP